MRALCTHPAAAGPTWRLRRVEGGLATLASGGCGPITFQCVLGPPFCSALHQPQGTWETEPDTGVEAEPAREHSPEAPATNWSSTPRFP